MALCVLAVSPVYCFAGLVCLCRAVPFGWVELLALLSRSAGVALASMAGPALVVAFADSRSGPDTIICRRRPNGRGLASRPLDDPPPSPAGGDAPC